MSAAEALTLKAQELMARHRMGCYAVWSKHARCSTVFGFDDELDAVEELFTSLLLQSTGALLRAGSKEDAFGRSRTKRFRRSFLIATTGTAFADRADLGRAGGFERLTA